MLHWITIVLAAFMMTLGGVWGHFFGNVSKSAPIVTTAPTAFATSTTKKTLPTPISKTTATTATTKQAVTTSKVKSPKPFTQAVFQAPKDWVKFSSSLGFSIRYPYKEVGVAYGNGGYFQMSFFIPTSIISTSTSTESLSKNINKLSTYGMFAITATKINSPMTNLKSWAEDYLKKDGGIYGNSGKTLSREITTTTFAGIQGLEFNSVIEVNKNKGSPRYARKDIFIKKNNFIYHTSSIAPALGVTFSQSGLTGKMYLRRVKKLTQQVLGTFILDGSKVTKFDIPKVHAPVLTGVAKARREELLAKLRTPPYYDMNTWYPKPPDPCTEASSTGNSTLNTISNHGLYVAGDDEIADLNVYDDKGRHTGPLSSISKFNFHFIEQGIPEVQSFNFGSAGYGLIFEKLMNARIELVGKKTGFVTLQFNGDGNSCSIAKVTLPMTAYSVATIPMTAAGDLGPISYDINGDGVQDVEISLIHPLTPQKELQLEAVFTDITGARIIQ